MISSGSLIKSNIFDQTGFFKEDFLIDHVDTEWYLRAKVKGFKI